MGIKTHVNGFRDEHLNLKRYKKKPFASTAIKTVVYPPQYK